MERTGAIRRHWRIARCRSGAHDLSASCEARKATLSRSPSPRPRWVLYFDTRRSHEGRFAYLREMALRKRGLR